MADNPASVYLSLVEIFGACTCTGARCRQCALCAHLDSAWPCPDQQHDAYPLRPMRRKRT